MSRNKKDIIVNVVFIIVICLVAFYIGMRVGIEKHTKESYETLNKFYYASLGSIIKNRGVIEIEVNGRSYEIGYSDRIIDGSSSLLVELDGNKIINVWNLAYNIESE